MAPTTRSATSKKPRPQYADPIDDHDDDDQVTVVADDEDHDPTYNDVLDGHKSDVVLLSRAAKPARSARLSNRTFEPFPRLPPEIRVMIWKFALQGRDSHTKGLQYFTIFPTDRPSPLLDLSVSKITRQGIGRSWGYPPGVTPPEHEPALSAPRVYKPMSKQDSISAPYSWFSGNRSLYAATAGIQFANWESRVVAMKLAEAEKKEMVELRAKIGGYANTAVCKVKHNEAPLILDVRRSDLFCFGFDHERMEEIKSIDWIKIHRHTMFDYWYGIEHMAFEFDASWLVDLPTKGQPYTLHEEKSPRGLFAHAFEAWCDYRLPARAKLFLVDRSIQMDKETAEKAEDFSKGWAKGVDYVYSDQEDTYVWVRPHIFRRGREKKQMINESAFAFVNFLKRRKNERGRQRNPAEVLACLPKSA